MTKIIDGTNIPSIDTGPITDGYPDQKVEIDKNTDTGISVLIPKSSVDDCATHTNIQSILGNSAPIDSPYEYITRKQAVTYGADASKLTKYISDKELVMVSDIAKNASMIPLFMYNPIDGTIDDQSDYNVTSYKVNVQQDLDGQTFDTNSYLIIIGNAEFVDNNPFSIITNLSFFEGYSEGSIFTIEGNFNHSSGYYDILVVRKVLDEVEYVLYNSNDFTSTILGTATIPNFGGSISFGVGQENSTLYFRFGDTNLEYNMTSVSSITLNMIFGFNNTVDSDLTPEGANFRLTNNIYGFNNIYK